MFCHNQKVIPLTLFFSWPIQCSWYTCECVEIGVGARGRQLIAGLGGRGRDDMNYFSLLVW